MEEKYVKFILGVILLAVSQYTSPPWENRLIVTQMADVAKLLILIGFCPGWQEIKDLLRQIWALRGNGGDNKKNNNGDNFEDGERGFDNALP